MRLNGWYVCLWCRRSHRPSLVIAVPAHIRLATTSPERLWKVPPVIVLPPCYGGSCDNFVNWRQVLRRDNHTCQYCGSNKHLTLDHVMPLLKGGQHSWNNIVTACEKCNQRQSSRTPLEAGMPLSTKPRAPMHPTVAFGEKFWRSKHFPPGIGGNPRIC